MEEEKVNDEDSPIEFEVVGLVTTVPFQQCRISVERLHKTIPKLYAQPKIRPMMNVEWEEYTTKIKRCIGGKLWTMKSLMVVVYKNGKLYGNEIELLEYIDKEHSMNIFRNFQDVGKEHLLQILQKEVDRGRQFAYLTVSINTNIIGTMLFLLYSDLVPYTSYRFLEKCKQRANGFINTTIHRIATGSWIQCGGFELTHHRMPCENYTVPHDRRGVLSMCHAGKHKKNSVQFFITLAPTPWMDSLYVAFGQLIHGANVLREIEKVPTYYESPSLPIEIVSCGEFNLYEHYSEKDMQELDKFIAKDHEERDNIKPLDIFDVDSYPDIRRYRRGLYSHHLDLKHYLPGFPSILSYIGSTAPAAEEGEREFQYPAIAKDSVEMLRTDSGTTPSSPNSGDVYKQAAKEQKEVEQAASRDINKDEPA